ncbi:MAG: HAMP domain-containing sensor histidine kinase [Campylobacterota bacterium]
MISFFKPFELLDKSEDYDMYQIYFINALSLIGIVFLSIFSVYNMFFGILTLGLWELVITLVLVVNFFFFQKHQNIKFGSIALMLIMIALSILLLISGGIENTGIFWLYIYPVLAFFLQGSFYGFVWVLAFIIINFSFAVMALNNIITLSYSFIEVRQFLISLFVLSIMVYFYEKVVTNMKNKLKDSNEKLRTEVQIEVEKNRKKEQHLIQQSRLAQMGEMISMIAHQWRQPLGAISTTTANLQMKIELQEFALDTKEGIDESNRYFLQRLKNINGFVHNLTTTIDDFRNFYKPNKKSVTITLEKVVLKSLNIIKASLINDNIEIIEKYNSKEGIEMYDSEMMQVVLNILKNSQDNFKEKNIKYPQIRITIQDRSISIYDNGGGIPEDIIEKIFDPYFSTKDEKNGTGLGLYMSKIIVEEHHNGKLEVENKDDGVCFSIELGELNSKPLQ